MAIVEVLVWWSRPRSLVGAINPRYNVCRGVIAITVFVIKGADVFLLALIYATCMVASQSLDPHSQLRAAIPLNLSLELCSNMSLRMALDTFDHELVVNTSALLLIHSGVWGFVGGSTTQSWCHCVCCIVVRQQNEFVTVAVA